MPEAEQRRRHPDRVESIRPDGQHSEEDSSKGELLCCGDGERNPHQRLEGECRHVHSDEPTVGEQVTGGWSHQRCDHRQEYHRSRGRTESQSGPDVMSIDADVGPLEARTASDEHEP